MDCIQTENKAVDLHGAGKHGFAPGVPLAGVLATFVSSEWCNGVQEEILNVIRGGGLVPSGADLSQMLQAINILIALRTGGPGEVKGFYRTTAPAGWLKCNGTTIGNAASGATQRANADTQGLFTVLWENTANADLPIQDNAGVASVRGASAADDFAAGKRMPVPDMRGEFVRGLDDGRGVDAGRALGSAQAQQLLQHTHGVTDAGHVHGVTDPAHGHAVTDPTHGHGVTDPTHIHSIQHASDSSTSGAGISGNAAGSGGGTAPTDASATGVAVNNAATGVTVNNAATGVTINNAGAGITIDNSVGGAELRTRNVALLMCISY
jgi:hypothetical protein